MVRPNEQRRKMFRSGNGPRRVGLRSATSVPTGGDVLSAYQECALITMVGSAGSATEHVSKIA